MKSIQKFKVKIDSYCKAGHASAQMRRINYLQSLQWSFGELNQGFIF